MITTKNKKFEETVSDKKLFHSIKNDCEFKYDIEAELLLMLLSDFDLSIDRYSKFEFRLVNANTFNTLESVPGLILERDSKRDFVIFSDTLAQNHKLTAGISEQIQKCEPRPISLTVVKPADIDRNNLINNIEILHSHALLPADREDFSTIANLLDLDSEISIGKLKRQVKNEDSIYQLMFHHALRADLESVLISDEIMVNASPIINSIIRNLEK